MYEDTLENADFPLPPSQSATAPKPAQIRARNTPNLKLNEPQSGSSIKAAATITYTIDLLRSSSARAISIPPMKTLIFNTHMGRFRSRGEVQSHIIRLRRLFRYPRSEPIARSGRFLARSNSHSVAVRDGYTNIPLAAVGAQEAETILFNGFSSHALKRFVHPDPPELIRSWKI